MVISLLKSGCFIQVVLRYAIRENSVYQPVTDLRSVEHTVMKNIIIVIRSVTNLPFPPKKNQSSTTNAFIFIYLFVYPKSNTMVFQYPILRSPRHHQNTNAFPNQSLSITTATINENIEYYS